MQVGRALLWALTAAVVAMMALAFVVVHFLLPRAAEPEPIPRYTIGEWEGQVAVFEGAQTRPMQVYDVAVSTLPEELRRQIARGVPAESEAQLSVLLEDYTG